MENTLRSFSDKQKEDCKRKRLLYSLAKKLRSKDRSLMHSGKDKKTKMKSCLYHKRK